MSTLGFVVSFLTKSSNQTAVCVGKKKRSHFISTDFGRSGTGARGKPVYVPSQKELGMRYSVSVFHLIWDIK